MSVWRTEYDELGGYDCMTPAYKIINPDGTTICVIDFANHQEDAQGNWITREERHGRVKGYADLMVRALNIAEGL